MWPFTKAEQRESEDSYTTRRLDAQYLAATGTNADPLETGSLEVAAGLYGRAFASADITGRYADSITPSMLSDAVRSVVRLGEYVAAIEVGDRGVTLLPASSHFVSGDLLPESWRYKLTLSAPGATITRNVPAEGVVHVRYAAAPGQPWLGLSPCAWGKATAQLSANIERTLREETSGSVGWLLPVPDMGATGEDQQDPFVALQNDLKDLRGRMAIVEQTGPEWAVGAGQRAAPGDMKPRRFGPEPPASIPTLRDSVSLTVLAAAGIPPGLVSVGSSGGAAASREAWRQFYFGAALPMARLFERELSAKLESPHEISLKRLRAADIATAARAFKQFAEAGMAVPEALTRAGLD